MKFLRAMLPNISIALNVSVLILLYLDSRNPMMGFLSGTPFVVLMVLTAASSVANAVTVYGDWRKTGKEKGHRRENERKISE